MKRTLLSIAVVSVMVSPAHAGMAVVYKDKGFFSSAAETHEMSQPEKSEKVTLVQQPVSKEVDSRFKVISSNSSMSAHQKQTSSYSEVSANELNVTYGPSYYKNPKIDQAVQSAQLGIETFTAHKTVEETKPSTAREYIVKTDEYGNVISTEAFVRPKTADIKVGVSSQKAPQIVSEKLSESSNGEASERVTVSEGSYEISAPKVGMKVFSKTDETLSESSNFKVKNYAGFDIESVHGGVVSNSKSTNKKVVFRTVSKEELRNYKMDQARQRAMKDGNKVKSFSINLKEPIEQRKALKENKRVIPPSEIFDQGTSESDYVKANRVEKPLDTNNASETQSIKKSSKIKSITLKEENNGRMVIDPNTLKPTFVHDSPADSSKVSITEASKAKAITFSNIKHF